ncbi:amylo-alpha-1,6-glucosidase [Mariniblastus sp.]|nr:amylo-alpha-1,6-glucosidase [Mariniblastus sp.]
MSSKPDTSREWLETDGLGAFASGTSSGVRTRRYHNVLMIAKNPPSERVILVNGFDVWVETPDGTFPISTQHYLNEVFWPEGFLLQKSFDSKIWPTWSFDLGDSLEIKQELFVPDGVQGTAIRWQASGSTMGVKIHVKPFLSARDYHSMSHENDDMKLETRRQNGELVWQPYSDSPEIFAESTGEFEEKPEWFRSFYYEKEAQRGLDTMEDLACPGEFHFDLDNNDAILLLGAGKRVSSQIDLSGSPAERVYESLEKSEIKRRTELKPVDRSALQYIVKRNTGKTIIAGYPWFTDWGRDTFIAIRGLCIARDDDETARDILVGWADTVSEGMIPNRFPDHGEQPEFNSVDASLWYIVAIHDYWQLLERLGKDKDPEETDKLRSAIEAILEGYSNGTRHGIGKDDDGLIAAGEDGVQLTWMDAKVEDWVVTPRIGKPVEIQCLWINALWIASKFSPAWKPHWKQAEQSFRDRFWNQDAGCLFDVVDENHEQGRVDAAIRPNQILAVGGLPYSIVDGDKAREILGCVESKLMTPLGPRSLAPEDPDYKPIYTGGIWERDGAYHQGTVWPWVFGSFVEAWLNVNGKNKQTVKEVKERFLDPLDAHLETSGLGHISEIADADSPHLPKGCPFQAWSLGEFIRIQKLIEN